MLFDIAHAKDVCLLGERVFGVVPFFKVIDPQSSQKLPKNQFLEKSNLLTGTLQNFATKGFTGTWIYIFLPSFVEIGETSGSDRTVRGIHYEKGKGWLLE